MAAGAKVGVKILTIAIGIPVGIVTRKLVEKAWATARPNDPARRANEADVKWTDALAWAALSAAGLAVSDLITRRSAAAAYEVITGNDAPPAKPHQPTTKAIAKSAADA